jgi:ribonucleotide reductase alpha subunit
VSSMKLSQNAQRDLEARYLRRDAQRRMIETPEELLTRVAKAIAHAYWRAWELSLKGITIYRYGSKAAQAIELGINKKAHYNDHASTCDPEECRV